jgi:hypothetical protein
MCPGGEALTVNGVRSRIADAVGVAPTVEPWPSAAARRLRRRSAVVSDSLGERGHFCAVGEFT